MGPRYVRPAMEMPASWRMEESLARREINAAWWDQFGDSVLNRLIAEGLRRNLDVKIALARVEEYSGRLLTAQGGLFPQVAAEAAASRVRVTQNGVVPVSPAVRNPAPYLQANASVGWEIDVWGKLRRAVEAGRADLLSARQACKGAVLSLVCAIAAEYLTLGVLDRQLEIARSTAKSREETYSLFKLQYDKGVISELELNQAKSEYEAALSVIPDFEKNIRVREDALSVLLGAAPAAIARGKTMEQWALPTVPAGLPSDLLRNRPDISQAENELMAANARIGQAQASYFPQLSLTGLFGWASAALSNFLTSPSLAWNYSASLSAPLFKGGAVYGQVKTATSQWKEATLTYQQTVLTVLREVEDALIDVQKTREQLDALQRQTEALRDAARAAKLRFENGYTGYLELLDAQRSLFTAELSTAQTKGALLQATINLYKALGGGWVTQAEQMAR